MKKYGILIITGICLIFSACATTNPKSNKAKSPVQKPKSVAAEAPVKQVEQKPKEEPAIAEDVSPEILELRDVIKQKNNVKIQEVAHKIIDKEVKGPDASEALRALAQLSIQDKKYSEAFLYIDAANSSLPDNYENMMMTAQVYHLQKKDDEAVKVLKHASELFPQNAGPHVFRASILLEFLDVERAMEAASTAYQISPDSCDAIIVYADALYASKQYEKAVSSYEKSYQKCTPNENVLKNMAKIYEVHVQNPQKSCTFYKKLNEIDPANAYYKASMDYQCGL